MDQRVEIVLTVEPSIKDAFVKTASSLEVISKKDGFDKQEFLETLKSFSQAVHATLNTLQVVTGKVKR